MEFPGPIDEHFKIRGLRIELGEIDAVLAKHAGVKNAVLVARDVALGEKRLVAYIVSMNGSLSPGELRSFMQDRLPDYMIPAHFVLLESLPLTQNGKVNRGALPAPDGSRPAIDSLFVAPRTPVEQKLAEIWQEVLSIKRVGMHDSFFELGGHSLLATQLISRVREVFKVDLPLRKLFEAPTVAALLKMINGFEVTATMDQAPPIVPVLRNAYRTKH
jgi:acyl carrier protein